MTLSKYTFVVLQYQHSPFAGERLNIGVLLVCPDLSFAELKVRENWKRISDAYPSFNRSSFSSDVKRLSKVTQRLTEGTYFRDLFATSQEHSANGLLLSMLGEPEGSLIWSRQSSGATYDAEEELKKLFFELVGRFDSVNQRTRRGDDEVFDSLKEHLEKTPIIDSMVEHTISSPEGDVRFKRSFKNGLWHCVQPLSFDHVEKESIDNKAARWAGHLFQAKNAPEEFQPYFIIGRPQEQKLMRSFDAAERLLKSAPGTPIVVKEEDSAEVADRLLSAFAM